MFSELRKAFRGWRGTSLVGTTIVVISAVNVLRYEHSESWRIYVMALVVISVTISFFALGLSVKDIVCSARDRHSTRHSR